MSLAHFAKNNAMVPLAPPFALGGWAGIGTHGKGVVGSESKAERGRVREVEEERVFRHPRHCEQRHSLQREPASLVILRVQQQHTSSERSVAHLYQRCEQ